MGWFENLIGKVCDYFVSYSPKYQTIQEEQKRLRASLESSEKERRELRTSLKSSADVVAELKSEISAEKNENGRLKNKLFEYAGQDAELDIARRQILGDIVNGVVYRRTISEQGERIGKLEESLSGQEEQIGEMRSTLSSQNDKIGELERFASDLVQKNKDTERQVELQMGNVAYLKGQLRDYFVETLPAILDSSSLGNRKLLLVRKDGKIYYSSRRVRSILGESNQIIFEKESNRGDVDININDNHYPGKSYRIGSLGVDTFYLFDLHPKIGEWGKRKFVRDVKKIRELMQKYEQQLDERLSNKTGNNPSA